MQIFYIKVSINQLIGEMNTPFLKSVNPQLIYTFLVFNVTY